jgi:hypothetical protein
MSNYLKDKFVRLRCRKTYPEAHTHLVIGKVVDETDRYIVMKGRTFHYKRIVDRGRSQVTRGEVTVRVIPWDNVEIIHELGGEVDYNADYVFDKDGNLVFMDSDKTMIVNKGDSAG